MDPIRQAVGALAVAGWLLSGAAGQELSVTGAVARLDALERRMADARSPVPGLRALEEVGRDTAVLLGAARGGALPAVRAAVASVRPGGTSAPPWPGLGALWLPARSAGGFLDPAGSALLAELGGTGVAAGEPRRLAAVACLGLLQPRTNGAPDLAEGAWTAFRGWNTGGGTPEGRAAIAGWLAGQMLWPGLDRIAGMDLTTGAFFHVLGPSDVPPPGAAHPGAAALYEAALAGCDRYADKWHVHGLLLDELLRRLDGAQPAEISALADFYAPWFRLLGHAGVPITPFCADIRLEPADGGGRLGHFAQPWEEDLPGQAIYSPRSHIDRLVEVQTLLRRGGVEQFDPGSHMFFKPFDVVEQGTELRVRARRYSFMGYLDAFVARKYPSVLRPWPGARGAGP